MKAYIIIKNVFKKDENETKEFIAGTVYETVGDCNRAIKIELSNACKQLNEYTDSTITYVADKNDNTIWLYENQNGCFVRQYCAVNFKLKEIDTDQEIVGSSKKKLIEENKELKNKIDELEQQLAYECECNKQFVECQNKNEELLAKGKELEDKLKELETQALGTELKIKYARREKILNLINDSDSQLGLDQLRCSFTTYCLDYDIECDTAEFDTLSKEIYEELKKAWGKENVKFKKFEDFDYWLGEFLS